MKKVVKEHYKEILEDLRPLFEKWGEEGVVGALWIYKRVKGKVETLKAQKEKIEKELNKYDDLHS